MGILNDELRERIRRLDVMCEETKEIVRQMMEATACIDKRDNALEGDSNDLKNSGE